MVVITHLYPRKQAPSGVYHILWPIILLNMYIPRIEHPVSQTTIEIRMRHNGLTGTVNCQVMI